MVALRPHTKVMLISDGPDELLGGYPVDQRAWEIDRLRAGDRARYGLMKALSATRLGRRALYRLGRRGLMIPPDVGYRPFHFVPQHQAASPDYLRRILSREQVAAAGRHYGVMDPAYDELKPELDYTQYRALSYAAISLPEMFNLRTDKSFLRAAIECRLPFQAPEMAEFQIALPAAMHTRATVTPSQAPPARQKWSPAHNASAHATAKPCAPLAPAGSIRTAPINTALQSTSDRMPYSRSGNTPSSPSRAQRITAPVQEYSTAGRCSEGYPLIAAPPSPVVSSASCAPPAVRSTCRSGRLLSRRAVPCPRPDHGREIPCCEA